MEENAPHALSPAATSGHHVLIMDDTQEILDLLQELLEDEGYNVTSCLDTLDLDAVKAMQPDVIVQDLLFGGMQEVGWKFLTLARLDPDLAHIPLVLCTAATSVVHDAAMAENLEQLGVRVLLKPFTIDDLFTVLRDSIAAPAYASAQHE